MSYTEAIEGTGHWIGYSTALVGIAPTEITAIAGSKLCAANGAIWDILSSVSGNNRTVVDCYSIKETNRLDGDFFFHLTAGKSIAPTDDSIVATSQLGTATPPGIHHTGCIGGKAGAVSYSLAIECARGCAHHLAGTGTVRTREDSVVAGSGLRCTTSPKSYTVAGIGGNASPMLDGLTT